MEYREAFDRVDTTGDGLLSASEIQQVFDDLGQPLSDTKLWKIFDMYDRVGYWPSNVVYYCRAL